jgi:hypothetical protein
MRSDFGHEESFSEGDIDAPTCQGSLRAGWHGSQIKHLVYTIND